MKKSITGVVVLLAGAFVAHSQGTVSFADYGNGNVGNYTYVSLVNNGTTVGKLGGVTGATASNPVADVGNGNFWSAALYGAAGAGDASSALLPLDQANGTPVTATFADNSAGLSGEWYGTEIGVVPGTSANATGTGPLNIATVQVYAWYNAGGTITSYAQALATPGTPTGFSSTATVTGLGGVPTSGPPITAPAVPTGSAGIGNFNVSGTTTPTPEPSTIALGIMGASAFLMRLRKKQ